MNESNRSLAIQTTLFLLIILVVILLMPAPPSIEVRP